MYPENILKTGARFAKSITSRDRKPKSLLKNIPGPTKIFYLWEKHGVRRIEMFCME